MTRGIRCRVSPGLGPAAETTWRGAEGAAGTTGQGQYDRSRSGAGNTQEDQEDKAWVLPRAGMKHRWGFLDSLERNPIFHLCESRKRVYKGRLYDACRVKMGRG